MPPQRDARGRFLPKGSKGAGAKTELVIVERGLARLLAKLRLHARGPHVRVGVQGQEAEELHPDFGDSNVKLAAVHEFGSKDGRIPQRSFIRATVDRERDKIGGYLQRASGRVARGKNIEQELGVVGAKAVAEIRRTIDQSIGLKPLTKAGILSKQVPSTKPLLDTGQLKNSVTWKVFLR